MSTLPTIELTEGEVALLVYLLDEKLDELQEFVKHVDDIRAARAASLGLRLARTESRLMHAVPAAKFSARDLSRQLPSSQK